MRPPLAQRGWFRLLIAALLALALVVGMVAMRTPASNVQHGAIRDTDEVVAVLHVGGKAYSETLRALLKTARGAPEDVEAAKAASRALIDEGRAAGDGRLVGASLGLLRPFMATNDPKVLTLAATARQYQHDFPGALDLLDKALKLDPSDANALLIRATIHIVLGEFAAAEPDCKTLYALNRVDLGFLCIATSMTLTANAPAVARKIEALSSQPQMFDPSLRPYALSLIGEIAALQGEPDVAIARFEEVLQIDPNDIRVRLMLADLLLQAKEPADVMSLLSLAPDVDGVLIRRFLAAQALNQPDLAGSIKAELEKRFRLNLDLGLTAHAREEAQYFLYVAPDPAMALERAQINWGLQHEIDDLRLLIDAAVADNNPAAAAPGLKWMADAHIVVPSLVIPAIVTEAAK